MPMVHIQDRDNKIRTACMIVVLLVLSAILRFVIRQTIFMVIGHTAFYDRMASMTSSLVLTGVLILISHKTGTSLSGIPQHLSWSYVVMEIIFSIGLWGDYTDNLTGMAVLLYSCVVTPVFEEIMFRGYIWNRISEVCSNRWVVYGTVTILFGLWHLAYMDSLAFHVESGLFPIMVWKVITGLCFGLILGAVRMKSSNCFATMLVHGALNLFAR